MKARMPRARWWRFLLDWLQWYGPAWLAVRVPPWGIDWIETNGVRIGQCEGVG